MKSAAKRPPLPPYNKRPQTPPYPSGIERRWSNVAPADLKRMEDTQMVIPDFEIEAMARVLLPALRAFYASEAGQTAFEEWKRNQGFKEENQ